MPMDKSDLGPEVDAARIAYGEACIAAIEAHELYARAPYGPKGHPADCKCAECPVLADRRNALFTEACRLRRAAVEKGNAWAALVTAYENAPTSRDDAGDDRLEAARARQVGA